MNQRQSFREFVFWSFGHKMYKEYSLDQYLNRFQLRSISEGGSSFSSWTLFSCEHGTGPINSGITVGSSIVLGSSIGAVAGLGCELDDSSSILYITNSDVDEHAVDGSVIFGGFSFTIDCSILLDFGE